MELILQISLLSEIAFDEAPNVVGDRHGLFERVSAQGTVCGLFKKDRDRNPSQVLHPPGSPSRAGVRFRHGGVPYPVGPISASPIYAFT